MFKLFSYLFHKNKLIDYHRNMLLNSINRTIKIIRVETDDMGTIGVLATQKFCAYTLELPWRDNLPFKSCIPSGTYLASVDPTVIIGKRKVIRLQDVKNRWDILLHVGNYAGDKELLYKSDVSGCICVGNGKDDNGQKMITESRDAMDELLALIGDDTVKIEISNMTGETF